MKRTTVVTVFLLSLTLFAITLPSAAQRAYVVQPGDTLASIARRYDVPVSALAAYNSITNWNIIYAGSVILIPPGSGSGESGTPPATVSYTVRPGDTLTRLALNYNTTVQAIISANSLTGSWLYVGQVLRIPSSVPPPETTPTPPAGGYYYTVQRGDTLFAIGQRLGVNIYRIAEANSLLNLNRIYAGVSLFIPR